MMKNGMTRRGFVVMTALSGVATALDALAFPSAGERGLRVGIMTDTHIGRTRESCARVRSALEFFRKQGLDMILHVGDVADHHYPDGYKAYRAVTEEVFENLAAAKRPKEIFTYAWHDAYDYQGHPRNCVVADAPAAFADMRRLLGNVNEPDCTFMLKGFPFVVVNQFCAADRVEKMVSEACRAHPMSPVFLVSHVPPQGTVFDSWVWGDKALRKMLGNYPQVIVISGHTHGSNRCELNIWQGAFSVVNAGCLQAWSGPFAGSTKRSFQDYGVLVMEVAKSAVAFRRYDIRTGEEYRPEAPWRIPLPFDPETAPYRFDRRKSTAGVPSFAAGAVFEVKAFGSPFGGMELSIPSAAGDVRPYCYRVFALRKGRDGGWERFATQEVCGDFHLLPRERPATVTCRFNESYFSAGGRYRFEVEPENFWGVGGLSIFCEVTVPRDIPQGCPVWETADAKRDLSLLCWEDSPKSVRCDGDGWYGNLPRRTRISFSKAAWAVPEGGKVRLTLDVRTRRSAPDDWNLRAVALPGRRLDGERQMFAHSADDSIQRFVFDITRRAGEEGFVLWLDTCEPGQIKLVHAKTEMMK